MPLFDLELSQLQEFLPPLTAPADFDDFWSNTIDQARSFALDARFESVDYGLHHLRTLDVTFNGYAGQPVKGWLILPKTDVKRFPCVVQYIGYGGGRGFPIDHLLYASAGFAHLVMDTRGQGSQWSVGDTPDIEVDGANPQIPGVMTRGILNPETYYYRRLFIDALRSVEAARAFPAVDPDHIALRGHSQGGGVALAVAALDPSLEAALIGEPYLCHFRRAVQITDAFPYSEIVSYCRTHRDKVQTVFNTLSYFDGMNFAARATVPARFSVGLMDDTCPPSTVFAAYNHYQGPKEIQSYEFNQHDGGGVHQDLQNLHYLHDLWQV